jgi:hypothetical protein
MFVEGFLHIVQFLSDGLNRNAEELTREQIDKLSPDQLKVVIVDLQSSLKKAKQENKNKSDRIWKTFLKI